MSDLVLDAMRRYSRLTPVKKSIVVFVIGSVIFTYGWLVFSGRPMVEVVTRGVAFGLAFAAGYYYSAIRS